MDVCAKYSREGLYGSSNGNGGSGAAPSVYGLVTVLVPARSSRPRQTLLVTLDSTYLLSVWNMRFQDSDAATRRPSGPVLEPVTAARLAVERPAADWRPGGDLFFFF